MPSFLKRFGTLDPSTNDYFLTTNQIGLIISMFNIGCMVGGIFLSKVSEIWKWGRKSSLFVATSIYIIGIIIQLSVPNWGGYTIGRIVSGFGVGFVAVVSPMFVAETAPTAIRGILVSCYQLMITLGIVLGSCSTYATFHHILSDNDAQWRIPLGISIGLGGLLMIALCFLPESSRYLLENGQSRRAAKSIAFVNKVEVNSLLVQAEFAQLSTAIKKEQAEGKASFKELFIGKPHLFYRLLIGVVVQASQQLTGINYFFYYSTSILNSIGLEDSFVTSIILGTVNVFSSAIALLTIEKFGRRTTMIAGNMMMALCLVIYAVIGITALYPNGYDEPSSKGFGIGMIVVTCFFILSFALSWGPGVFVILSETYPLRVRANAMSIAGAFNWLMGFLIALFTPTITAKIKFSYGFVFFGCTIFSGLFVYFMVPETKGLTLEEIDDLYHHYKPLQAFKTRKVRDSLVNGDLEAKDTIIESTNSSMEWAAMTTCGDSQLGSPLQPFSSAEQALAALEANMARSGEQ